MLHNRSLESLCVLCLKLKKLCLASSCFEEVNWCTRKKHVGLGNNGQRTKKETNLLCLVSVCFKARDTIYLLLTGQKAISC